MAVGDAPFWFPVRKFDDDVGLHKNFRYLEDYLKRIRLTAGGGHATVVIAPETSSRAIEADYLTDGTNDEVQIAAAFADLPATGGTVVMLEGDYSIDANLTIPNPGADTVAHVRWIGNGARLDINAVVVIGDTTGSSDDFFVEIAHFSIRRTQNLTTHMFNGRGATINFHDNYVVNVAGCYSVCGGTGLLDWARWHIHSNLFRTIHLRKGGSGADDGAVFLAGSGGSREQRMRIYGNIINGVTYTAASGFTANVFFRGSGEMIVFGNEIKNYNTINGLLYSTAIYAFHNVVDGVHTDGDHNLALDDLTDVTITGVADNQYLVYDSGGAVWQNEGLDISLDTTPVLGGALDAGGFDINNGGVIFLTEQAAAEADVAGKGQIWVKTATPNQLWFTDDAGTDAQIEFDGHTHVEADITDLQSYLLNVVEDTTPQLGGNLDVNGNSIVSTAAGNITLTPDTTGNIVLGAFTLDADQTVGAGQDNYVLTYDNATGLISLEAASGGGLNDVVDDLTPQLGGSLDVNGQKIVSVTNGNIDIEPHGTGNVLLGNFTFDADQTVGAGQDNYVLTYDNAGGLISLEAVPGASTPDEIQTTTGPDASDYWNIVEIDGGDSLIIQQWDNSAAGMLERLEIVGKGTGLTDEGDIKLYDLDGLEILRWDESTDVFELSKGLDMNGSTIYGWEINQTGTGPDASDVWGLRTVTSGDKFSISQWDDSAAGWKERISIIGTGTGVTDDGDIQFYKADGSTIAGEWDESENEFEWATNHDFANNGINGLQFLRMSAGPDASDYWSFEYTDSGDSVSLRQWDNSAAGFLDRFKIIGKGTAVTDQGDIIFYDDDGAELMRWDESAARWQMAAGQGRIDFAGGSSQATSLELINSYDADMKITATGAGAAARDLRIYANDATPTERLRFEIIGDGEMNFYDNTGTLITTLTELDDLTDGGTTALHSHAGGGGGNPVYLSGHPFMLMGA